MALSQASRLGGRSEQSDSARFEASFVAARTSRSSEQPCVASPFLERESLGFATQGRVRLRLEPVRVKTRSTPRCCSALWRSVEEFLTHSKEFNVSSHFFGGHNPGEKDQVKNDLTQPSMSCRPENNPRVLCSALCQRDEVTVTRHQDPALRVSKRQLLLV